MAEAVRLLRHLGVRLCLVLMLAAIGLPGLPRAQETVDTDAAIVAEIDTEADEAMRLRLRSIFRELEGLSGVFVTVRGGIVTLSGTVAEPDLATEAVDLAKRLETVIAVRDRISVSTSLARRLEPVRDRLERRVLTTIAYLPLTLVALVVFGLFTLVGLWVAARQWPWSRIAPNAFIAELLRQLVRLAFGVLGLVVALDILGAASVIGTILGAAGIVGLAIGFAVRDTVENYIASILLSVRQPFAPNDLVEINGFEGHVIRLTARATVLLSLDGNHIRIPNATVFKSVITNFSRNPERRLDFTLGINGDGDPVRALATGQAVLSKLDFLLAEPAPGGWLKDVGDFSILLTFTGWIDQRTTSLGAARTAAVKAVMDGLEADGFTFPEPTQRVRVENQGEKVERQSAQKTAKRPARVALETGNDHAVERMADEQRDDAGENLLDNKGARSEL